MAVEDRLGDYDYHVAQAAAALVQAGQYEQQWAATYALAEAQVHATLAQAAAAQRLADVLSNGPVVYTGKA
jgi:hypothetical protein